MNLSRRHVALPALAAGLSWGGLTAVAETAPLSRDEAAVIANTDAHRAALFAADAKVLEALSAPQLSYGHSDGRVEDRITFVANATNGKTKWLSLAYQDVTARIVGNTAITRFKFVGENQTGDKRNSVNLGVLMVWQKQGAMWKVLARQAYKS
jgi:hypothetical protein